MNKILGLSLGAFTLGRLLGLLVILAICAFAIKYALGFLGKALGKSKMDQTLSSFILSAVKVLLIILTVLILADKAGIPVNSLIALFSVATLALSLAAQGVLSNVFGGIILLLTKPFKAGDYIEANGTAGFVQKIGLSHTELLTWTNERVVIPNSELSGTKIKNYAAEDTRRVDVNFAAAYTAPTETVKDAVAKAAAKVPGVFEDPAPVVIMTEFADGGIKYVVRVWCRNDDYWAVMGALTESVREALGAAGCEMSYSHVNVHVLQ